MSTFLSGTVLCGVFLHYLCITQVLPSIGFGHVINEKRLLTSLLRSRDGVCSEPKSSYHRKIPYFSSRSLLFYQLSSAIFIIVCLLAVRSIDGCTKMSKIAETAIECEREVFPFCFFFTSLQLSLACVEN